MTGGYYSTGHTYDTLDRLTSATGTGGAGTYTYGDAAHLHAVTSTTSGYSASYDAAGNMTCRALTSATTCAGSTPTGQTLSYDNEGRLVGWQNTPTTPTSTATDAYDGEGNRVAQQSTPPNQPTSTTYYVAGGLEEINNNTLTKYERVPGVIGVVIVGTGSGESVSYLAADGLGSVSEAVDGSGNVLGAQLYGPFGGIRYSSGTMPTARGYTGQYADAVSSGLDYYGARYYDPVVGQFTSADTLLAGGLNRYAYVGNNPETATDPTGHHLMDGGGGDIDGPIEPVPLSNGTFGSQPPCDACIWGGVGEEGLYQAQGWVGVPSETWFYDANATDGGAYIGKNPDGTGEFIYRDGTVVRVDADGNVTAWDGQSAAESDAQAAAQRDWAQELRDREETGRAPKSTTDPTQPTNEPKPPAQPPTDPTTPAQPSGSGGTGGTGGFGDGNGTGDTGDTGGTGKITYVIGENMDERVIPYAEANGYKYYDPTGSNPQRWLLNNKNWLWRVMRNGYDIVDIGPAGPDIASPYYQTERDIIARNAYPYYRQDFQP